MATQPSGETPNAMPIAYAAAAGLENEGRPPEKIGVIFNLYVL